jgi:hypothetical protein
VWRAEDVRRQVEENKRMGAAALNVTVEKVRLKHQLEAIGDNDPEARARWGLPPAAAEMLYGSMMMHEDDACSKRCMEHWLEDASLHVHRSWMTRVAGDAAACWEASITWS